MSNKDLLTDILHPDRLTAVVDIGASPVDGKPPYHTMLQSELCNVVGFEPQAEALAELKKAATVNETYLPLVIGNGKPGVLHLCRSPGMTSLLEPDPDQLALFNLFSGFGKVLDTTNVDTVRLDDVTDLSDVDFVKIDVQGSELTIFNHGKRVLEGAVAVQTEVSFVPLYKDQPTFWEVDRFFRKSGFTPHRFMALKNWALAPTIFRNDPRLAGNQVLEADVVYVRNLRKLSDLKVEKLKHLALLSHHVFGSPDLVILALRELEKRDAAYTGAIKRYLGNC